MFFLLPLIVAIAFLLITDIDSPRGGVIRSSALPVTFCSKAPSVIDPEFRHPFSQCAGVDAQ